MEEKYILAHGFRDSTHGRPTPLLYTQSEAKHHGRMPWWKISIHGGQKAEIDRWGTDLQG